MPDGLIILVLVVAFLMHVFSTLRLIRLDDERKAAEAHVARLRLLCAEAAEAIASAWDGSPAAKPRPAARVLYNRLLAAASATAEVDGTDPAALHADTYHDPVYLVGPYASYDDPAYLAYLAALERDRDGTDPAALHADTYRDRGPYTDVASSGYPR